MSLRGGRGELRDWIGQHLDPLEAHDPHWPVHAGPVASDYDLSKAYGPTEDDGPPTPAAVLIGLVERDHGLNVLLTRRADTLRRHTGQIALPGGRRDPGETPWQTALREAHEEIGLERSQVRMLAELPPTSTFATNYVIHPFVATIPAGIDWRPSAREVDAVLELPLGAVRASRTRTQMERRGIRFETDAFIVDEHLIWGATARIIENLLERLPEGAALDTLAELS